MVHDVGRVAAREIAHLAPDRVKRCDVKQSFAAGDARLHPFVVGKKITATPGAMKGSSEGADVARGGDEPTEIDCEGVGVADAVGGGGLAG